MAPPKAKPLNNGKAGRDAPVLPPGSPTRGTARAVAGGLTAASMLAPTRSVRSRAARDASQKRQSAARGRRQDQLTPSAATPKSDSRSSTSTVRDNLYDFQTGTWGNPDGSPGSPV